MDKISAQRRKYDPFWGIDPIDVTCDLLESIDLLEIVSEYMEHESSGQPFTPILRLTEKRSTRARFEIIDRSHGTLNHIVGSVELILTGKESRITFEPAMQRDDESAIRYYYGLYRVVLNVLLRHDVLLDAALPSRLENGFADTPNADAGDEHQATRVDQLAIRLPVSNTTIERVETFISDFSVEYQHSDRHVGVERSVGGDRTLFNLCHYHRRDLSDAEQIARGVQPHAQNAVTFDTQRCGTIRIKPGILIGQFALECSPLTDAAKQFVDALADRLRTDQHDARLEESQSGDKRQYKSQKPLKRIRSDRVRNVAFCNSLDEH